MIINGFKDYRQQLRFLKSQSICQIHYYLIWVNTKPVKMNESSADALLRLD